MKRIAIHLVLALLLLSGSVQAQGWRKTFAGLSRPFGAVATPDGGAAFVATVQEGTTDRDLAIVKTSPDGRLQWTAVVGGLGTDEGRAIALTPDNSLVAAGRKSYVANNGDVYMVKLASDGGVLWERTYNYGVLDDAKSIRATPDGGLVVALEADNQLRLLKTDAEGLAVWSVTYPQTSGMKVNAIEIMPDSGFLVTLLESNLPLTAPVATLLKVDKQGALQFEKNFPHFSAYSSANIAKARPGPDGNILLAHRDSVYRLDAQGNILNALRIATPYNFYLTDVLPDGGGGFWAYGTGYVLSTASYSRIRFGHYDAAGMPVAEYDLAAPAYSHTTLAAERLGGGGFALTGYFIRNGAYTSYLLGAGAEGRILTNRIEGRIFWDKNQDCISSPDEPPLPGRIIRVVHPNGEVFYASTDSLGYYAVDAGTGTHALSVLSPNSVWETACVPTAFIPFDTTFAQTVRDFPVKQTAACPLPWVDLGLEKWMSCTENEVVVRYANQGAAPAFDARIRLALDTLLELSDASAPFVETASGTYTFSLGDLLPLQNGALHLQVTPACDGLETGQAKCLTVSITLDAPCLSASDGPLFVVTGRCDADSVRFFVQNTGTGLPGALEFIIIEDDIMYTQPDVLLLAAGGSAAFPLPANGSTWRFEARQDSGVPDWQSDAVVAAVVEGCTASGAFSTGFTNQFSLFDGGNFQETECREVIPVPEGSGKSAYPSGYDDEHFIPVNTDIEYVLSFENKTPDTVRAVYLRDTLAPFLNPASVRPGVSSHPCLYALVGPGVLIFEFDSMALAPGARGWARFRVAQLPDLPSGTLIRNRASIGFGFDAPFATNETFHTVAESLLTDTQTPAAEIPAPSVSVSPAPARTTIRIDVPASEQHHVVISTTGGQVVAERDCPGSCDFDIETWPVGVYFVSIRDKNGLMRSGRFIKTP